LRYVFGQALNKLQYKKNILVTEKNLLDKSIDYEKEYLDSTRKNLNIVIGSALLIYILGGWFWYCKFQIYQDKKVKLEFEKESKQETQESNQEKIPKEEIQKTEQNNNIEKNEKEINEEAAA